MTTPDTVASTLMLMRSRRRLVLAAVALVALAATVFVASIGADDAHGASLPTAEPVADDDVDPTSNEVVEEGETGVTEAPMMTYEVFLTRDPFQPVVPEEESDPTLAPPDPSDPTSPDAMNPTSPTPVTPRDPTDPACVGSEEVVCDGRVLSLVDITTLNDQALAVVQVDTIVYQVLKDQLFADGFQVRAFDGTCVSMLYGDDGFRLCLGDTILK